MAVYSLKTNDKMFDQVGVLPSRHASLTGNTVVKDKRSRSIASPSGVITKRPVVRKIVSSVSSNNLLGSRTTQKMVPGRNIQGAHDESRRNAVSNVSYSERKNRRRGSLFTQGNQRPRGQIRQNEVHEDDENGDLITINEINLPGNIKRHSLQIPSQLFRGRRKSSAGDSVLSAGSGSDFEMLGPRSPLAANLNRRRRSRAPDVLARELELMVPKPNPVAKAKLARYFRIVKVCVSLCRWSYTRAEEKKDSFLGFAQVDSEEHNIEKLFFNPSYFKANRQQRLTGETKRILTLASWKRTKEEVRYVQIALRNIRAFAEYPLDMQYKLSRVGWLEEYGPKRAILRQGHLPDAFYFIISGTLVVTVLDLSKGKPIAQTVAFLKRGDSFGELAILNNTRRASTVITKDTVQLLCISVEDFEDIFMLAGGMKSVSDPQRNSFIRNLNMFRHWPLEELADHPQDCLFHFFKYGDVLVKDSEYSDWIYIVKSGRCSVLKKLKRTPPKVSSKLRRATPAETWNKGNELGQIGPNPTTPSIRPKSCKKHSLLRRRHSWPSAYPARPARRSASSATKKVTFMEPNGEKKKVATSSTNSTNGRDQHKNQPQTTGTEDVDGVPEDFIENKRTFHSDLDASANVTFETTEADLDPIFIVVQVLNRGETFGVHGSVFLEQPNLSVISNGAECILIRKRFWLEHATDQTFGYLRRNETPYPSNAELQEKLQIYRNWNSFRNHTFKQTVYETRAHKQQRLAVAT